MMLRTILCCATLALGLAPVAAEAAACKDQSCKSAAQPLQLNKFMKPAVARQHGQPAKPASKPVAARGVARTSHGVAKKRTAESTRRVLSQRRAPTAPAAAASAPVPNEAADAFAKVPPVHIVSPDEVNEIDLAAGPAPVTDGSGRSIQLVAAADYNEIDRQADDAGQARAATDSQPPVTTPSRIEPPRGTTQELGWFERLWTAIQGVLSSLAAMLSRLAG